jgi:hypothetical protein
LGSEESYVDSPAEPTGRIRYRRRARGTSAQAADLTAAATTSAEVHEVGDFSIFEAELPVTIPSKRSTVIPVFNVGLSEVKSVLHYKHENHPSRPYRSVDFKNQTGFSLGRGVCTVFEEAAYSGNCIMPVLKQEESRLLPHALETGVSVQRDHKQRRDKVVGLRLSQGFSYTDTQQHQATEYHVKNSRDKSCELILDHNDALVEPEVQAQLIRGETSEPLEPTTRLAGGARYSLTLGPKCELIVRIAEHRIDQTSIQLVRIAGEKEVLRVDWLYDHYVKTHGPLALNEDIRNCVRLQRDMETKQEQIADAVRETERFAKRQARLRENIKSGGQDELTNRWRTELDEAEQAIRKIEEEDIPAFRQDERTLRAELVEALKSLSLEWSDETK